MGDHCRPHACAATIAVTGALFAMPGASAGAAIGDRVLREGDRGRHVRVLQRWLTLTDFQTRVDGRFGRRPKGALRRYEHANRMRVDGVLSQIQARGLRRRAVIAHAAAAASGPQTAQATAPANGVAAGDTAAPGGRTALAPASALPQVHKAIEAPTASSTSPTAAAAATAPSRTRAMTARAPSPTRCTAPGCSERRATPRG